MKTEWKSAGEEFRCMGCGKQGTSEHTDGLKIRCKECGWKNYSQDSYKFFAMRKAMELGSETCTHTILYSRGGQVYFKVAPDTLIHQARSYYDMNRYMNENWNEILQRLNELSEVKA